MWVKNGVLNIKWNMAKSHRRNVCCPDKITCSSFSTMVGDKD